MIFFSWEHRVYILMGFKSHIDKKNMIFFARAVATTGLLLNPDRSSHRVDPPGRAGFNNNSLKVELQSFHSLMMKCILFISCL